MDQSIRKRRPDEVETVDSAPAQDQRATNFLFVASSPNAIRTNLGDRRFAVIDLTEEE